MTMAAKVAFVVCPEGYEPLVEGRTSALISVLLMYGRTRLNATFAGPVTASSVARRRENSRVMLGSVMASSGLPSAAPNMVSGDSSTSRLACSMRPGVAARWAASTIAGCSGSVTGGGRNDIRSSSCAVR